MKAVQVVITPKPMPKAKATIRAAQDVPKAFQDKSFQDRTRIRAEDHGLGVSKRPKLYDLKPNPSPVVNINIFGGLPGSGAASSSGAWACILFYVFSWSSVLQILALFFSSLQMAYPGSCRSWPPSWEQLEQASTQRHLQVRRRQQVILLPQGPSFRS